MQTKLPIKFLSPARASARGFTLVEVMIVVTIIGLLAAMAIPAFELIRQNSRRGRYINDLRVFAGVFQTHVMATGIWPESVGPGVIPPEVIDQMPKSWTEATPLGGRWQWSGAADLKAILLVNGTVTAGDFDKIDRKIDDGNSSTGLFRLESGNWAFFLD